MIFLITLSSCGVYLLWNHVLEPGLPSKAFRNPALPAWSGIDHSLVWIPTLSAILSRSSLNIYLCVCFLPRLRVPGGEAHSIQLCVYSPLASPKQGLSSGFGQWKTQGASTLHRFTVMFLFQFYQGNMSFHITARLLEWDENELETIPDLSDLAPNYKHLVFFVKWATRQENKNGVYLIRSGFLGRHMR